MNGLGLAIGLLAIAINLVNMFVIKPWADRKIAEYQADPEAYWRSKGL